VLGRKHEALAAGNPPKSANHGAANEDCCKGSSHAWIEGVVDEEVEGRERAESSNQRERQRGSECSPIETRRRC
jgi:hypothetical protein